MATLGGKQREGKTKQDFLKQFEEWKKQKKQQQPLSIVNQIINPIAKTVKQIKPTVKRHNTFSATRRSPRIKENIDTKPNAVANNRPSGSYAVNNNQPTTQPKPTKSTLSRTQSESAASRQERLQEWKRKKEEEKRKMLEERLQARTPVRPKTPGRNKFDNRPPFDLTVDHKGILDRSDRRDHTLDLSKRLTLGTSGLERRKSYAEHLRTSGKKPDNSSGLKRSSSAVTNGTGGVKRSVSNKMGACQALIKRRKLENQNSMVNVQRSSSCASQSAAAIALQRRKSYGQGLRATLAQKSVPSQKERLSLKASTPTERKGTKPQGTPAACSRQGPTSEKEEFKSVDGEHLPEIPATAGRRSSRRDTFTPEEAHTPVEELKKSTGPGTSSTPQPSPALRAVSVKSRKSILKPDQQPKTPGHDRKVQFRSPSSAGRPTPGRRSAVKPVIPSCSWTPQKELSMREKLNSWLISKGRTPSRFRHLHCFDEQVCQKSSCQSVKKVDTGLSVHELQHQQDLLDEESRPQDKIDLQELLAECTDLVDAGCPGDTILSYLNRIEEHLPSCKQESAYWICRARVAEEGDCEEEAVDMYEAAVVHAAQPARDIIEALKGFVTRMEDRKKAKKEAAHTPWKPHFEPGIEQENMFESSSIKYSVSRSTPLMKRLEGTGERGVTTQAVITPVRRSTRLSHSNLPSMLQDHDEIIDNMEQLPPDMHAAALFQPNRALQQEFDEATDDED